jgi:putative Mg2+ transporter-C (MgtC) family protein
MPAAAGPFLGTCAALLIAFVCGGLIGLERQIRQRNAGLRTMVLVSVGAAAFVNLGGRLLGADGETRIIAYVVSGIGFLGAGVIMKEGLQVRGLNTAATLWATAAVGAFAGGALYGEAGVVTALVLAGNTLLRPLVDYVNRRPVDSDFTEALYQLHVTCDPANVGEARDLLAAELEKANYPVSSVATLSEAEDQVELAASLIPTSAEPDELDAVCAALEAHPEIMHATWSVSTTL